MRAPLKQGDLDGLCGLYALVNATVYLTSKSGRQLSHRDRLELFKVLATRLFAYLDRRGRSDRPDDGRSGRRACGTRKDCAIGIEITTPGRPRS